MSCDNDSHLLFVYGTLKSDQPNHFYFQDEDNGKAKILALARTSEKYPLIVATEYNIPFLLAKQGSGHVSIVKKVNMVLQTYSYCTHSNIKVRWK